MIIERRCVRALLPHHRRVTPPTRRRPDFAEALQAERSPSQGRDVIGIQRGPGRRLEPPAGRRQVTLFEQGFLPSE
jgi:hypothetical protein